jgi:hypothetical protein
VRVADIMVYHATFQAPASELVCGLPLAQILPAEANSDRPTHVVGEAIYLFRANVVRPSKSRRRIGLLYPDALHQPCLASTFSRSFCSRSKVRACVSAPVCETVSHAPSMAGDPGHQVAGQAIKSSLIVSSFSIPEPDFVLGGLVSGLSPKKQVAQRVIEGACVASCPCNRCAGGYMSPGRE